MFGPIAGAALAIGGGALSYGQAQEQNRAARRSSSSARRAAGVSEQQVNEAAELEKLKRRRDAERIAGRIRVAAAASGFDTGSGDFITAADQNELDLITDQSIIERNASNQIARIRSGLDADLTQIRSRMVDPLVAAFGGGLQGGMTGLQIGGAVDSYNDRAKAQAELERTLAQGGI